MNRYQWQPVRPKIVRDFGSVVGGDSAIRCMILGDSDYNLSGFRPEEHERELRTASELLDAYGTDLALCPER